MAPPSVQGGYRIDPSIQSGYMVPPLSIHGGYMIPPSVQGGYTSLLAGIHEDASASLSHLEIFGFQDMIKIKNKTTIFP